MILLMGGTTESLSIADFLTQQQRPFILSVVSQYGAELAQEHAAVVSEQALNAEQLPEFLRAKQIDLVIDATHPFAKVASENTIAATKVVGIPYVRFEREQVAEAGQDLRFVDNLDQACALLKQLDGTVYLSTGSKTVGDYIAALGLERIHVRVLPVTRVFEKLTALGLRAEQIDGIRGPFTTELNVELFKRVNACAVVTKESGRQGGIQEKITACAQLNIPCIIIKRPAVNYPVVVKTIPELATTLAKL
ncbi:precorrin-6A reductase [Loigolactobacillus jiayinensis]|uniref:Precorrin-6A reductase n=1 Tax=Loigolactobacillus jiayinensis TaxID=2486016 RepID=A0ABW1RAL7_9LACO|nr:precorrin-6A reductase [Loigolactobacillus jiayinensis]